MREVAGRLAGAPARELTLMTATAALGVGVAAIMAPRVSIRAMGLEAEGRGVLWATRLLGCRDVGLGMALLRTAVTRDRPDPALLDLVAGLQVGDVLITTQLWRRGQGSRRAMAAVWGGGVATMALAAAARAALRVPPAA